MEEHGEQEGLRSLIVSKIAAATSGDVDRIAFTASCTSSPLLASITVCSLSISARKPESLTVWSNARRSASTRSGGTPGGVNTARAVADWYIQNSSIERASGALANSTMVGTSGYLGSRAGALIAS